MARLGLAELLLIAERVLDTAAEELKPTVRIGAAESALAAPFASAFGIDFYPEPAQQAAICCSRLLRNHPFLDGNKRIAYECMREMLERDGLPWPRPSEDAEEIADVIEAVAAREMSEEDFVLWVQGRTGVISRVL